MLLKAFKYSSAKKMTAEEVPSFPGREAQKTTREGATASARGITSLSLRLRPTGHPPHAHFSGNNANAGGQAS